MRPAHLADAMATHQSLVWRRSGNCQHAGARRARQGRVAAERTLDAPGALPNNRPPERRDRVALVAQRARRTVLSGQQIAHGNGHAVLAGTKFHVVARSKRRNLLIVVA